MGGGEQGTPERGALTRHQLSVPSSVGTLGAGDLRPVPKRIHSPQPMCHLLAVPTTQEGPLPHSSGSQASLFSSQS